MRSFLILLAGCVGAYAGNSSCSMVSDGTQWRCVPFPIFATVFDGASTGAQIDAACASLAGTSGVINIPPGSPLGDSLTGLPNGCIISDFRGRGLDIFGNPSGLLSSNLMQVRSINATPGANVQTQQIAMTAWTGGVNKTGGPKMNYSAIWASMVGRTSGQTNAYSFSNLHFANGDTIGLDGFAQSWGRNNAAGDEGTEALTLGASQGDRVFTGIVTAINGTQITYVSPVNENVRGEDRPLIITTPAKVYSQGTITATSGVPPVVVGDGNQDWTTLGTGPVTNLFLSIDSQMSTFNALKMVVPVRSITDASHLILDYVSEGSDSGLPVTSLPSSYKLFRGGNVTGMPLPPNPLNSLAVAVATDFAVGDTFEQPLGYAHTLKGIQLYTKQYLPFSSNAGGSGITVGNIGTVTLPTGYALVGNIATGFYGTAILGDGLLVTNNPTGALVKSGWNGGGVTNLLGAFTGAGQNTFFSYDRTVDVWKTARPINATGYQSNGAAGVDCSGPPTTNFRVSKGIVISC